ncbi:MAG: hypothetical protein AAB372_00590 [Patescibacteria group bacterium]
MLRQRRILFYLREAQIVYDKKLNEEMDAHIIPDIFVGTGEGVPIYLLVNFILEKEKKDKTYRKDLEFQIKDCVPSGLLGHPYSYDPFNGTARRIDYFVCMTPKGRKLVTENFIFRWLYFFEFFLKEFDRTNALIVTLLLSSVFWGGILLFSEHLKSIFGIS